MHASAAPSSRHTPHPLRNLPALAAGGGAAPLHWLPPAAAWVTADRVVALGGLELDDKQALFPRHAHGSPYPSNALVVASLQRQPG